MLTGKKKLIVVSLFLAAVLTLTGCQSDAQSGALIGGLAGAGIGQLAGRDTEGTLIGAAVGTGAGYIIGNERDKKKAEARRQDEISDLRAQMNTVTVHITNSNGSISAVQLHRSGPGYVGPRGEYYPTLPTEDQLRPIYGF